MVKVSLFWEQLIEFQVGSHAENVRMVFLFHQRHSGTQAIKQSVCLSESVKRVEQGGHYFAVVEIEGGREKESKKDTKRKPFSQGESLCCKHSSWCSCDHKHKYTQMHTHVETPWEHNKILCLLVRWFEECLFHCVHAMNGLCCHT